MQRLRKVGVSVFAGCNQTPTLRPWALGFGGDSDRLAQHPPRAHADETGWPRGNQQKGWLWTLCCTSAAVFMIQAGRGQAAARKLLGAFFGSLHFDRWSGYS